MKKLFLSVGLVAAGTAALQAAYAPDQGSTDATRMWGLSGSLRGFYDNNYTASSVPVPSSGFEITPTLSINVPMQQTEFGMRFVYGLYYYSARANQDPIDQTFRTDLWLDHAFTERWQVRVEDTFLIAQDPLLEATPGDPLTTSRSDQSYLSNDGTVTLHTDWTRLFSTSLYYTSLIYDYQNTGGNAIDPSLAGTLNRMGNTAGLDFQWQQSPTTILFIGYQVSGVNYTGDETIAVGYVSDDRNSFSQAAYLGATHYFSPNLIFNGRFGAQYSNYYNDPQNATLWNPYGNISLSYTYQPGCFASIGFTETMNPTDQVSANSSNGITLSQQSSVIYGSINHQITPKLRGSIVTQVQFSSYNGGTYAGDTDTIYGVGLHFSYAFTRHFSADIGDSFDQLNSQIPGRGYNRNRIYAGVTATY